MSDSRSSKEAEAAATRQKQKEFAEKQELQRKQQNGPATMDTALEVDFEGDVEANKESVDYIMEMYMKKVEAEGWNNKGWYKAPVTNENGRTQFSFPDEETCMSFFGEIAEQHQKFIVLDATTGEVLAYSTGDGNLYKNEERLSLEDVRAEVNQGLPHPSMKPPS